MTTTLPIRVTEEATAADGRAIWPLYDRVFGDYPTFDAWREAVWDKHRIRRGFRLARADGAESLIGFAYGYTGQPGQWWTDNVRETLRPEVADAWLGGHFEVVSLGVAPDARRAGVGRGLLRALVADLEHDRLLLMTTDDVADPARRLYTSDGWQVIGPGIGDATVILGKRATPRPQPE